MSNHDQVLLVHPVSDTPILDLAQPLMGPYAKVGTLRVDSVEQGLQDLTSRITLAMIEQLVGSGVMLHSAVIGDRSRSVLWPWWVCRVAARPRPRVSWVRSWRI